MAAHFTPETMKFLRGLARHNDREWFEARRDVYERALRSPMLAVIEEINAGLEGFAPEHVRPPAKIVMHIYRDTRFSNNKLPYKTQLAAWWSRRGMEKTSGGGFYLQVRPEGVMIAAGVYMPERAQLLAIRRWMSTHHEEYRAAEAKLLRPRGKAPTFDTIAREGLTRMPKGFAPDDPADELLRAKNWGVQASLPADVALEPGFAGFVIKHLRAASPLVNTLNAAILGGEIDEEPKRKPMF